MDFDRLSSKYYGATAALYEAQRFDRKWVAEQRAVEGLLEDLPKGCKVLDAPVGTGRLIPLLARRGAVVYGLDVSADMLSQASAQAKDCGKQVELREGDLRKIPFADASFDLVICLRFLNWIGEQGVREVVNELSRVSRSRLLIGVRYLTPSNELKWTGSDLVRRAAILLRLPSLRTRRWGIILHRKSFFETLLAKVDLRVVTTQLIERRWDCTDYVFYSLEKPGPHDQSRDLAQRANSRAEPLGGVRLCGSFVACSVIAASGARPRLTRRSEPGRATANGAVPGSFESRGAPGGRRASPAHQQMIANERAPALEQRSSSAGAVRQN